MWKRVLMGALTAVLISGVGARAEGQAADPRPPASGPKGDRNDIPGVPAERRDISPEPHVDLGEFWIGLECYPAPPPLTNQLGLLKHGGLVIERVVPESPAAQAGLKRYDVIVRAGNMPVSKIADLAAAVNDSGEVELELEIIRTGKRTEVAVTPCRRPDDDAASIWREPPRDEDLDRLWPWFGRMGAGDEWRRPFRLHFFHPGAILPHDAQLHPPLPDNMSVTIQKQGKRPANVIVKRGDDSWEITEHELDELPDDVRPHVERMLGRWPVADLEGFQVLPHRSSRRGGSSDPSGSLGPSTPEAGFMERQLHQQLDEMGRRLDEMRRSLQQNRAGRERDRPTP